MSDENVGYAPPGFSAASRSGPPEKTLERSPLLAQRPQKWSSGRESWRSKAGSNFGHDGPLREYFDDYDRRFSVLGVNEAEGIAEVPSPEWRSRFDRTFSRIAGRRSGMEVELRSAILFIVRRGRVARCQLTRRETTPSKPPGCRSSPQPAQVGNGWATHHPQLAATRRVRFTQGNARGVPFHRPAVTSRNPRPRLKIVVSPVRFRPSPSSDARYCAGDVGGERGAVPPGH